MNLFEQAARTKLRIRVKQGLIAPEDLWDLPVSHSVKVSKGVIDSKDTLNSLAMRLDSQLADQEGLSYVDTMAVDPELLLTRDLVVRVLKTKLRDQEKALDLKAKHLEKKKLLSILAGKEEDELKGLSADELRKRIKNL